VSVPTPSNDPDRDWAIAGAVSQTIAARRTIAAAKRRGVVGLFVVGKARRSTIVGAEVWLLRFIETILFKVEFDFPRALGLAEIVRQSRKFCPDF
jgi:hypothetical protein